MSVSDAPRGLHGPVVTGALVLGFLAVVGAVISAHAAPATDYELSIYAGTPPLVWGLLAVGFLVALGTVLVPVGNLRRGFGLLLGGLAATTVVSLPVLRGYYFLGSGDSLTHLGWTRDMATGVLEPTELLYPAYHVAALQFARLAGVDLNRGLQLTLIAFATVYLVFVPLVVRRLTGDRLATGVAAVAAWMFVPVDNVAVFMMPYPTSLALFLLPALLFVLLFYLRSDRPDSPLVPTAPGVALALVGAAMVLTHPQQAANVFAVLLAGSLVQAITRRWAPHRGIARLRPLYGQTALFAAMLAVWTLQRPRFQRAFLGTLAGLTTDIGGRTTVAQHGSSLTTLGSSIPELFAKIYLVSSIFLLVTAAIILVAWLGRGSLSDWTRGVVTLLGVAGPPLVLLFGLYFLGTPRMAFRALGFVLVLATILGAAGLAYALHRATTYVPVPAVSSVAAVVLGAMLVLALLSTFMSPWIYRPTQHVTGEQMAGYEAAVEHRGESIPLVSLRGVPDRYVEAVYGVHRAGALDFEPPGTGGIPQGAFARGRIAPAVEGKRYLTLTEASVEQETVLYEGFRFPRRGFEALDHQPRIDRVHANGGFRLYLIDGTNGTAT